MLVTSPKPRDVDFERVRALDLINNGARIQISKKSLMDMLTIQVPDPNDTTFLAELRPQRLMSIAKNLGQLAQTQARNGVEIQERIAALHTMLDTGLNAAGENNAAVGSIVSQVLGGVDLEDLQPVAKKAIFDSLRTMNIVVTPEATEIGGKRYLTRDEYIKNFPDLAVQLTARAMALSENPALRPPGGRAVYLPGRPIEALVKERRRTTRYDLTLLELEQYWQQNAHSRRVLDVRDLTWVDPVGYTKEQYAALTRGKYGTPAAGDAGVQDMKLPE